MTPWPKCPKGQRQNGLKGRVATKGKVRTRLKCPKGKLPGEAKCHKAQRVKSHEGQNVPKGKVPPKANRIDGKMV